MSTNCRPCERRTMRKAGLIPVGLVALSRQMEGAFLLMRKERTTTAMMRYEAIEEIFCAYMNVSPRYRAVVARWLHGMHVLLRSRGFWDKAWFSADDVEHLYD